MDKRPDPFEEFYCTHFSWVIRTAAPIVGRRDAEDVAQEVFARLALAHEEGRFTLSKPALPYLRRATFWAAQDHLRGLHGERLMAEDAHDEENEPMDETLRGDPERALAVRRARDELAELLEALRPERRIVWVMSNLHKMTQVEIAETLELLPSTVNKRLHRACADFDAALARKRAAEKRKRTDASEAGALLLLPLDADAIVRMERALPVLDEDDETRDRLWRRIQAEVARRRAQGGAAPPSTTAPKPPPRTLGPRLKANARPSAIFALGTVVGVLAAMVLADTHSARPLPAGPPHESAIHSQTVAPPAPPPTVDTAGAAPMGSASAPMPPPSVSSERDLLEANLVMEAEVALEPPSPNPELAVRLLDRYAARYPESRRFTTLVARLRREARRLLEQKR